MIDKETKNIIKHSRNRFGYVDTMELAENLGFEVYLGEMENDAMSILLLQRIGINQDLSFKTKRFLIAYHISERLINNTAASIRYADTMFDEKVYKFATNLLVPNDMNLNRKIENLANSYGVNDSIVEYKKEKIMRKGYRK